LGRKKTILFNFCPFNLPACVLKHWKLAKTEKRLLCQSLDETENTFCTFVHPGSCQEKRENGHSERSFLRGWSVNPCDLKKRQCLDNRLGSIFSRMLSTGSRFTLGVWGGRCVRSTLRSRAQPVATVCARTIWPCLWEVCKGGPFRRSQTCRCFVSHGRRGTS
jgi:hypothetical protein